MRPFIYAWQENFLNNGKYEEDRRREFPVQFFVSGGKHKIAGIWSSRVHLFGVEVPARIFLMGTDQYGRDQFSRVLHGAQVSFMAGPLAAMLAICIGLAAGGVAGYFGAWTDELIMAAAELFLCVPWLYLLIAVRALLPLDLEPRKAFFMTIGLLGILGWARPARLVRGVVLSAKEREYVRAARGFGASDFYLLRKHVLPQTRSVLLTQAALLVPSYILAEITLSFLGLGINEPEASLGTLLASLQSYHVLIFSPWMWLPALALVPAFLNFYFLAHALSDVDGQVHPWAK
ncbi:MAG: ABC transporter permease [Bryobacteraceae bacterium]